MEYGILWYDSLFSWHFKSLCKLPLTVGQKLYLSFSVSLPLFTPLSPPVGVWIHPSLILFHYGSLKPQRSFVRLFVRHPVEGVCLSPSLFIHPSILHFPLSNHFRSLSPSIPLVVCFIQSSSHLSFISFVLHQVLLLSLTLCPLFCLAERRTVRRPGSSPLFQPGRKNKQASTCSQGILMTSITLASLPAKPQAAWAKQWTWNEPV